MMCILQICTDNFTMSHIVSTFSHLTASKLNKALHHRYLCSPLLPPAQCAPHDDAMATEEKRALSATALPVTPALTSSSLQPFSAPKYNIFKIIIDDANMRM